MYLRKFVLFVAALLFAAHVVAMTITVKMYQLTKSGEGSTVGTVTLKDTDYGMLIIPNLYALTPGIHGFHVHQGNSCANEGKAAGDHLDPFKTGKHLGPYNDKGHLGDLPALCIGKEGKDTLPVLAPRLTVSQVRNHALIIHAGGDNYSDSPEKLGGGGTRIACGIVK